MWFFEKYPILTETMWNKLPRRVSHTGNRPAYLDPGRKQRLRVAQNCHPLKRHVRFCVFCCWFGPVFGFASQNGSTLEKRLKGDAQASAMTDVS